jgi:hypothetical protein
MIPSSGYRPYVGRRPASPHIVDGIRIDPSVSSAMASGAIRAATATADPPLLPPGTRAGSYGLCTAPNVALLLVQPSDSSCRFVFPMTIAPCASKGTSTPALALGRKSRSARVPFDVASVAVFTLSFTGTGSP